MNQNIIRTIESEQLRTDLPNVEVGDTVRVHLLIREGKRQRTQIFEGTVLKLRHGGIRRTITVRKLSSGVGVERVIPIHSPKVEKIEIVTKGRVRRANLGYLRGRVGKAAKVRPRRK